MGTDDTEVSGAMRINQNIAAFNAYRNLSNTQNSLSSTLEKLSSGFRINRAADDASGLVNSENLRAQIGGLKVATRNAQDAISMVQTAEGAQTEVHSILQRMRDLTVQSGNLGTNDANALSANQAEMDRLVQELDRIADETQFGTQKILNGDFSGQSAMAGLKLSGSDPVSIGNVAGITATNEAEASADVVTIDAAALWDTIGTEFAENEALHGFEGEIAFTMEYKDEAFDFTVKVGASASEIATAIEAGLEAAVDENGEALFGDGADKPLIAVNLSANTLTLTEQEGTAGWAEGAFVLTEAESVGSGAIFQVGANEGQTVEVSIEGVSAETLGVVGLNIGAGATAAEIETALGKIDGAITIVSENRAALGAFQNRMESTIRNLSVAVENLSAAESRIRDTDMALEMVEFTRNQILSQAGTAMLAQANVVPQSVLSLLG